MFFLLFELLEKMIEASNDIYIYIYMYVYVMRILYREHIWCISDGTCFFLKLNILLIDDLFILLYVHGGDGQTPKLENL